MSLWGDDVKRDPDITPSPRDPGRSRELPSQDGQRTDLSELIPYLKHLGGIKEKLEEISTALQDQNSEHIRKLKMNALSIQKEKNAAAAEIESLKLKNKDLSDTLTKETASHTAELERLKAEQAGKLKEAERLHADELAKKAAAHAAALDLEKSTSAKRLEEANEEQANVLKQAEKTYKAALDRMKDEYAEKAEEAEKKHAEALKKAEASHADELAQVQRECAEELEKAKAKSADDLKQAEASHADELAQVQRECTEKLEEAERKHDEALKQAEASHADELARVQRECTEKLEEAERKQAEALEQAAASHAEELARAQLECAKELEEAKKKHADSLGQAELRYTEELRQERERSTELRQEKEALADKLSVIDRMLDPYAALIRTLYDCRSMESLLSDVGMSPQCGADGRPAAKDILLFIDKVGGLNNLAFTVCSKMAAVKKTSREPLNAEEFRLIEAVNRFYREQYGSAEDPDVLLVPEGVNAENAGNCNITFLQPEMQDLEDSTRRRPKASAVYTPAYRKPGDKTITIKARVRGSM